MIQPNTITLLNNLQSEVSGTLISSVFLEYGSVIRSNDGAFGDPITYGLVNQLTIIDEFWTQLGIRPPQSATDIKISEAINNLTYSEQNELVSQWTSFWELMANDGIITYDEARDLPDLCLSVVPLEYTVTFNFNNIDWEGGTTGLYGQDYSVTLIPDANYSLPSTLNVTRGGIAFSNYTYNSTTGYFFISGTYTTDNFVVTANGIPEQYNVTTVLQNLTFSGASTATFGVNYTGTFTPFTGYILPSSITVVMGGRVRTNYTYNSTTGDFVYNGVDVGGDITITASAVLNGYPVTKILHNVNFDGGDTYPIGSVYLGNFTPVEGYTIPPADGLGRSDKIAVTPDGVSWAYYDDGSFEIDDAESAVTIEAWGLKIYNIFYNLNGGVNNPNNPSTYTYYTNTINLLAPTKANHVFDGWYSDPTFTAPLSAIPIGSVGDKTFYAKFTPITYSVTENLTNLTFSGASIASYGVTYTGTFTPNYGYLLPSSISVLKNGTTFTDYTYNNTSGAFSINGSQVNNNFTITATAIKQTYTVTWYPNGGNMPTGFPNPSYNQTSLPTPLPIPTKTGQTFENWYADSGFNPMTLLTSGLVLTDNLSAYAKYITNTYDVAISATNLIFDGATTAEYGFNYSGTFSSGTAGYDIPSRNDISITIGGTTYSGFIYSEDTGTLTISGSDIIGNISIIASGKLITYNIFYNLSGGTGNTNPATYTTQTPTITLSNITKDYHSFDGWYSAYNYLPGTQVTTIPQGSIGDKTLYAKFTPSSYSITKNLTNLSFTGGNTATYGIDYNGTFTPSSTYSLPSSISVSRNGTTFTNYTYDNSTGSFSISGLQIIGNFTITAVSVKNTYTITWYPNGGTMPSGFINPSYNQTSLPTPLPIPTKLGYNFENWYADSGFNPMTLLTSGLVLTSDLSAYANYNISSYSVYTNLTKLTFSGGNTATHGTDYVGTFMSTTSGYKVPSGENISITIGGTPYIDYEYTENGTLTIDGADIIGNISITASAEPIVYSIFYNLAGGTGNTNPPTYTIETPTITLTPITLAHHTFNGWYTSYDFASGTEITTIPTGSTGNKTLYAKLTPNSYFVFTNLSNLTFNGSSSAFYSVNYNATLVVSNSTLYLLPLSISILVNDVALSSSQYAYNSNNGSIIIYGNSITGAITINATARRKSFTLTYQTYGGTLQAGFANPTYNVTSYPNPLPTCSKNYYTFGGWFTGQGFLTPVTAGATIYGDTTIYAKFTPIVYNITYNLDDGINNPNNPSTYTAETPTITLASPTKNGYVFDGWYSDPTFTEQITSISTSSPSNITIYAKWTIIPNYFSYRIDNNVNDGETLINVKASAIGYRDSEFSNTLTITKLSRPILTLSMDGLTISWDEVQYASGYDVYYSRFETGTKTLVSSGSVRTYNIPDSFVLSGETYYFFVRALPPQPASTSSTGGYIKSNYSNSLMYQNNYQTEIDILIDNPSLAFTTPTFLSLTGISTIGNTYIFIDDDLETAITDLATQTIQIPNLPSGDTHTIKILSEAFLTNQSYFLQDVNGANRNVIIKEVDFIKKTGLNTQAFEGAENLTLINNSENLTYVSNLAFNDCTSLAGDYIFNNCTFGENCFSNSIITSITLNGTCNIGTRAFATIPTLTSLTANSLRGIGEYAFSGCDLRDISINSFSSRQATIGEYAFDDNPNLSVVNLFAINETNDLTFDPACFNGCGSNLTYGTIFNVYYISPPKIIPETIGTQNGTQKIGFEGQYGKVRKVNLLKNEVVRGNYSNSLWWAFYRNIIGDLE